MKVLVYGAGVLGCNLARNMFRAGKDTVCSPAESGQRKYVKTVCG